MSYNKSGFTWNSWFTNLDIKTLQKIWGKENDHKDQLHEGKKNIANKLFGENGNDSLYGGKKSDTLKGGKGSDRLRGGAGNDKIHGGTGRDTAVFSARENQINLKSNKFQNSGDGHDLLISIENINAGGGNDVVTGNRSANTIKGQNGNDSLNGAPGHDYLIGGRGHDNLKGGSGNDKLIGGQGHDKLFGGSGRDTFVLTEGSGDDHIMDFHNGQDRIAFMAGVTNLVVRNSDLNANIYKGNDLLAVVRGGANQLLKKGEFLV